MCKRDRPIAGTFNNGDIINLKKSLRHDPIIDMIKGDVHLLNLKIYYEESTQTIHFLTPYDTDYFGDIISGFLGAGKTRFIKKLINDN